jgi:hypothetical protein
LFLFFLFTYKDNGFPAIFFTSSKLYHTIYRMNQKNFRWYSSDIIR